MSIIVYLTLVLIQISSAIRVGSKLTTCFVMKYYFLQIVLISIEENLKAGKIISVPVLILCNVNEHLNNNWLLFFLGWFGLI